MKRGTTLDRRNMIDDNRPQGVSIAVKLLLGTIFISIARLCYDLVLNPENPWNGASIMFPITCLLLWGMMIYLIYMRKNWVRILFSVIIVVGTLGTLQLEVFSFLNAPVQGLIRLVNTALQVAAMVFLFKHESIQWYKKTE